MSDKDNFDIDDELANQIIKFLNRNRGDKN